MSSANIGWLFYKDYFKGIDYANLDNSHNEIAINQKVKNIIDQTPVIKEAEILGNTHFTATTTYPGLLLGSGNTHELPSIKGQAILGFHFDYTSGLPVIQGSSTKGVLRSAFRHWEYIAEIGGETLVSQKDVESLETEIFDNGDSFFDATLSGADGKILGDDYITPHPDALKNPIPLRFIKVLPNVTFRFDFELSDGILARDEKRKLFQHILEDLGLGAKTNVGYGKFENFNPYKTEEEKKREEEESAHKKEQDNKNRLQGIEDAKGKKEQKAKEGIDSLLECKTLPAGFKLLKDSFGAKPKPTAEQKKIIEQYFKKQKNLSKSDKKVFKKYGIS